MPFVRKCSKSTLATQTHRFLCAQQIRCKTEGLGIAMRRTERLFGEKGTGRSSGKRGSLGRINEKGEPSDPRSNSCVKAFVRLLLAEEDF
eukprot:6199669-Pleurochrysis_carterae.AAC.2